MQDESRHLAPVAAFFCQPGEPGASAQTYSCWGFEGPALIRSAAERSYSACAFRIPLDENEREHTKTGKRDRDEETTGNEVIKGPHDQTPLFDQLC